MASSMEGRLVDHLLGSTEARQNELLRNHGVIYVSQV